MKADPSFEMGGGGATELKTRAAPRVLRLVPARVGATPPASTVELDIVRLEGNYERYLKPVLDRLLAALLLLLLVPLILTTALTVAIALGSPVLLRQQRVGRGGAVFTMYKFRTMEHCRRSRHEPIHGPDRRRDHKSDHDPRHTPVGRFLRAWSLDELPQLLNVLQGHMSLVGPRPELVPIVERYEPWQHRRHAVKPGLTGLWQVTERETAGRMHEHVATDLRYVEQVTLRSDLAILLRTVPVLLGFKQGT